MARSLAEQLANDLAVGDRAKWIGPDVSTPPTPTIPYASLNPATSGPQDHFPVPVIAPVSEAEIYDPSLMATVTRLNEAKTLQQKKETGKAQVPETMAK